MKEFHKYPKIHRHDKEDVEEFFQHPSDVVYVQEKLDGANFRFGVFNGKLIFGSRNTQLTSDEGEDTNVNKQFRKCVDYIRENVNKVLGDASIKTILNNNIIFYGECMTKHTIDYDWENTPPFIGIDVYDLVEDRFVEPPEAETIFKHLNLPYIGILETTSVKDLPELTEDIIPKSKYYSGPAEGIVLKNYDKQIFCKLVSDKFKEENRKLFGGSPKHSDDWTQKLVLMYCTNPRIEKIIFKLLDEGHELGKPLMHELPDRVYYDIWEEEWKNIVSRKNEIDLKKMKKLISTRCYHVLINVIQMNENDNR